MADETGIDFEVDGEVLVMRLNRPQMLNPISVEVREAWNLRLQSLQRDTEGCRAVVLTGTGRAFSAGGDVSQMPDFFGQGPETAAAHMARFQEMCRLVWRLPVPVIAAINGSALGGGTAVSLMSDIRIAGESSVFAVGQVHRVVVPDVGCTYILPRLIGVGRAMELMLTGRRFDAAEALEMGMINRVVPDDEVFDQAMALAREIAALPAPAVSWIKRTVYLNQDATLDQALANEVAGIAVATGTDEFAAELKAFFEKRSG